MFASYLRVYEPLVAFDRDRQLYWRRYVKEGRAVAPSDGPGRQRTAVLEALGAGWTRLPDLPDEAYVLEADDTLLVCPWNLRIRVAEAALTARDGVPSVIADAFVPPGAGRAGPDGGRRLAQRRPRPRAGHASGARAGRDLGGAAALVRVRRRGGARADAAPGPAGTAVPHGDVQGPPPSPPRARRPEPGHRGRARSPARSRRPRGGSRSSTPGRWSSSTTAGWSPCSPTTRCARTIRRGWSPPGWPGWPVATPTRPRRPTRRWSTGGVPSSFSNGATDHRSRYTNTPTRAWNLSTIGRIAAWPNG